MKLKTEEFKNKCIEFRKQGKQVDMTKIIPTVNMKGKNINFHHLMEKEISELLKKTKIEAKNKKYKFVWIRDARILVRKEEGSAVIQIESIEDLRKIN